MDEDKMRFILECFTAKIKEDTDQKLELIYSKLNTINSKLDETNNNSKRSSKRQRQTVKTSKSFKRNNSNITKTNTTKKNKIHLNDMRIRELEEELEKCNNAKTDTLTQLYTTVGVLKAQIAQLTTKLTPQPTF